MTELRGIDISSHQPVEDWPTLYANGIRFVAIKRVGGDGYVNPYGRRQVAGARAVGMVVIHYLYLGEPGCANVSGVAQADFFAAEVGDDLLPGEGISVDWEENGYADIGEALACLGALEARYGFKPSIYTYPSYIAEHGLARDARVAQYPLWFASYRSTVPAPPAPWSRLMAWQYSDNETIPGVGHVDGDIFFGTVEQLKSYGKPGDVTAEVVVPNSIQYGPYGKMLGGGFRKTYEDAGANGLALYGFPVTNEITEGGITVQYFERARFEYHADTGAITFGRVGAELARLRGLSEAA